MCYRYIKHYKLQALLNMAFFLNQTDLKLKLQKAEEEQALKEVNMRESIKCLTKEKDKLLYLSMERGKVIQVIICSPD